MILKDMAQLKGREIPKIQLMLDSQERKSRTFLLNLLLQGASRRVDCWESIY
jgi:hypothetical protein